MNKRSMLATIGRALELKSKSALPAPAAGRGIWGPIRESFPGAWQQGVEIDPVGSLVSYSPVYACVNRISSDIAKLGLTLRAAGADGITAPAPATSPYWTVLRKPNSFQNRIQFIRHWLVCKLLFGNSYAVKMRDARGLVVGLFLLDPRRVTPLVTPDGGVYYGISGDALARVPNGIAAAPATEIIHDRCATLWHPLVGIPPLYACALSGSLGLRIQQNSLAFFGNMSRPSGLLTAPGTIDEVTADRLTREWNTNFSGGQIGKTAVLGDGLEYKAMTIAAEQSQLAEQLGLSAIDVATAYSMPAYKINQGQMPTNNNVQALDQQYYSACLQVHIEDIELCLDEGLGVPPGYSVEFDLDGLLRMDSATQMDVLTKGVGGAILKPDEARRKLNLGSVVGGDQVYLQQQNYSLAALAKRDAQADPFTAGGPAAAPSQRELSHLVARALDELIELMPPEQRAAFLVAKDCRWMSEMTGGAVPPGSGGEAPVTKEVPIPDLAPLTEAQIEAARAQARAADAWAEAAHEQADAAKGVSSTAELTARLQAEAARDIATAIRPAGSHVEVERDPETGLITGLNVTPRKDG